MPKKPVGLRLVRDFTHLKRYIDRPVHPFPTTEDIQRNISAESRYFAKIDLVSAYHQVPLAEEDQALTTFLLPWGRFYYTRTPMGLAPSGDYACCLTDQALEKVKNVIKSVDDALCEDKGWGPYGLVGIVEEVLKAF